MPISRRERATKRCQKTNDLAREAVGCIGVFGDPARRSGLAPACADHTGTAPRRQNEPQSEPRPSGITPCTTGLDRQPRSSGITFPSTSLPHNGPSYHAGTTSLQHNGRSYHAGTTGFGTTKKAQRAFRKPDSPHPNRKENDDHAATGAERFAHQLRRHQ